MYHTNTQNLTCPHCGLTRVQKVSVKVANETIGGRYVGTSFQGGLVLQSSSNQSYSAFLLSPPKQPIYREPGECFFIVLGIIFCLFIFYLGWGLVFVLNLGNSLPAVLAWVVGVLVICIVFWVWFTKAKQRRTLKRRAIFEAEMSSWNNTYNNWDQLYFCETDGGVFDPHNSHWVPASEMTSLLH